MSAAVISGGTGAARFLAGLVRVISPAQVSAIINVGDDFTLHGLCVSPDVDTITYTLADEINHSTGWGRADETWRVMEELGALGGEDWFRLGDADLALHLYRTQRLSAGATLSQITAEVCAAKKIDARLMPVTDDKLRTYIQVAGAVPGTTKQISFQDYFVAHSHQIPISAVRIKGAQTAKPAPGVIEALRTSRHLIIAPSNPFVSIDPVLAISEVREALIARRDEVIAVSPIVGGQALKGPADKMMTELGHQPGVAGIAAIYSSLAATLVIDRADAALASAVEATGMRPVVTDTIMTDAQAAAGLAETTLSEAQ